MKKPTTKIIFIMFLAALFSAYLFYNAFASLSLQNKPKSLTDGLVGHWTFDGPDMINNVADSSGNGNSGYLKGTFATATSSATVLGKAGQALDFNGSDDYVNAGSSSNLDNLSAITVSVWIFPKSAGASNGAGIISKILANQWGWKFHYASDVIDTKKLCFLVDYDTTDLEVRTDSSFTYGEWHHVVMTWDGSTDAVNGVNIYKNGQEVSYVVQTDGVGNRVDESVRDLIIGASNVSGDGSFDGYLDDVRIYNRALSASEVTKLYNSTKGSKVNSSNKKSLTDGLVGYWTFDGQDMINNVADVSGNGNTGYLNGTFATATSSATVLGKVGQALDFNGVDDYIENTSFPKSQLSSDFTVSAWSKVYTGNKSSHIISTRSSTNEGWAFKGEQYNNTGNVGFTFFGVADYTTSIATPVDWAMYTAVYDASAGTVDIYVNDSYEQLTVGTLLTTNMYDGFVLSSAHRSNAVGAFSPNIIDDVRIYNRALSASEVTKLYNSTKGNKINTSNKKSLTDDLVGHWTFDGADMINNVADVSGQGNTGYLNGQIATSTIIGKVGQAIDFSGSSDYVETTNMSQLDSSSELTICSWVNLNTIGTTDSADDGAIFSRDTNLVDEQILFWYNVNADGTGDHTYSFDVGDTVVASNRINGTVDIAVAGKWQYVCGVMNGTYRGLYVDGILNASRNDATQTTVLSSTANARIGGWSFSANFDLNGKMDDVRVYSKALSASEIKRLYNMGR